MWIGTQSISEPAQIYVNFYQEHLCMRISGKHYLLTSIYIIDQVGVAWFIVTLLYFYLPWTDLSVWRDIPLQLAQHGVRYDAQFLNLNNVLAENMQQVSIWNLKDIIVQHTC